MPEISDRLDAFFRQHDASHDVECVRRFLHNLTEALPQLAGDMTEPARAFMLSLYRQSGVKGLPDNWYETESLSEEDLRRLRHYANFVAFRAYAHWGIAAGKGSVVLNKDALSAFHERSVYGHMLIAFVADEDLRVAIQAANARLIVDEGGESEGVTAEEIAALAKLDLRSVKNLLTPAGSRKSGMYIGDDGLVRGDEARAWLLTRKDYLPTISGDASGSSEAGRDMFTSKEDVVFVPVAEDGSSFRPEIRNSRGFSVLTPSGETWFQDYWEALQVLQLSEVPSWRRPGPKGRLVLVNGTSWKRLTRQQLEQMEQKP